MMMMFMMMGQVENVMRLASLDWRTVDCRQLYVA